MAVPSYNTQCIFIHTQQLDSLIYRPGEKTAPKGTGLATLRPQTCREQFPERDDLPQEREVVVHLKHVICPLHAFHKH